MTFDHNCISTSHKNLLLKMHSGMNFDGNQINKVNKLTATIKIIIVQFLFSA